MEVLAEFVFGFDVGFLGFAEPEGGLGGEVFVEAIESDGFREGSAAGAFGGGGEFGEAFGGVISPPFEGEADGAEVVVWFGAFAAAALEVEEGAVEGIAEDDALP